MEVVPPHTCDGPLFGAYDEPIWNHKMIYSMWNAGSNPVRGTSPWSGVVGEGGENDERAV